MGLQCSCERGRHIITICCAVLAVLIALLMPSCRHQQGCKHGDDAHYAQLDSMLKNVRNIDSLAAWVQYYREREDRVGEFLAMRYYGRELRHQSRFDEAITVHEQGLENAIAACDTLEILIMLNNLGADYRHQGNLSKANGLYYKALQIGSNFSELDCDECFHERIMALNGIGNIELELRHYAQADSLFHVSLRGAQALGSHKGMAVNCASLGNVKRALCDTDSSWSYQNEALKYNQLIGDKNGEAKCHLNFGDLYVDERNYSHAQVEFKQAYDEFKEQGDTYYWLEACLSLAALDIITNETDEARRYLQEAEAEAVRIRSMEHQAKVYYMYFELAQKEGDVKRALDYHLKSDEMYDSIYGLEKNNEMRHQIAEYEANIKQGEMSVLNNDIKRLHRTRNMMGLFTALLVVMAGAIIASLLYATRVRMRTQKLMRQVEETRSMFFSNVVHQLRTPLTAIMGATDAIVAQATADAPSAKNENVEIIEREGHHLLLLVDRILEVGSVRSAIKGPDWRTGDVVGYIRMIVESYREACLARQIELTYAPSEREVEVDVVPEYLNTILGSLIENAISYSGDYGKITVTSQVDGDELIIKVADNGMGISEEDLPHVFNAFYRAAAAEQMCEGVGIGLTVVRDMATVMGGSVNVESKLGAGSVFTVTLPCRSSESGDKLRLEMVVSPVAALARKQAEAPQDTQQEGNHDRPVVLVVEDHNDVARIIGAALQPGCEVHYATNGEHGLARAKELVPDIIITDVKMPYMDGLELCRRVRASSKLCHVPVIILSARTSPQDRIRGIEAGADLYMVKPFAAEEMRVCVSKLVDNRKMLRHIYSNTPINTAVAATDNRYGSSMSDDEFLEAFAWQLDRIAEDGAGRVDVDKIATRMKVGESYMRNRIMKLTGMKVSAYITQLRMHKAMDLLSSHPDLRVNEVAEQCGYSDVAYFSRVFRQYFKMSPTAARKQQSQDSDSNA